MKQKATSDNDANKKSAHIHTHDCNEHDDIQISRRMLFGTIILIVGFGLLFHNLFGWSFNYFWPLTIIILGLYIIFRRKNESA